MGAGNQPEYILIPQLADGLCKSQHHGKVVIKKTQKLRSGRLPDPLRPHAVLDLISRRLNAGWTMNVCQTLFIGHVKNTITVLGSSEEQECIPKVCLCVGSAQRSAVSGEARGGGSRSQRHLRSPQPQPAAAPFHPRHRN